MITVKQFIETLIQATKVKTLYVMGGFGAPAGYGNNRARYINAYPYNQTERRAAMINNATNDTFFFDCVCLIKGILWGWNGDTSKPYGGAVYQSNGVPDFTISSLNSRCTDVATDMREENIRPGEILWMDASHCGVYIGEGLVVESSPAWKNGVQITHLLDRKWDKHGRLPYINYEPVTVPEMICPCCGAKFALIGGDNNA